MKKQRNKYLQEVKQFNDKLKDPKYNSSERFYEFYTATVRYAVFPISWHSFYVNQLVTHDILLRTHVRVRKYHARTKMYIYI